MCRHCDRLLTLVLVRFADTDRAPNIDLFLKCTGQKVLRTHEDSATSEQVDEAMEHVVEWLQQAGAT